MGDPFAPAAYAPQMEHSIVHRSEAEFCGWPYYCGLWKVGNGDLVTAFKRIPVAYSSLGEIHHDRLTVRQGKLFTIRSTDGGRSWDPATFNEVFDLTTLPADIAAGGPENYADEGPVDFRSPDTLIMSGAVPTLLGPNSRAWLRASTDGGLSWRRLILLPIGIPLAGFTSLHAFGSSCVRADGVNLIGGSTTSEDGWSFRPLVYASANGMDWHFLSFITPEVEQLHASGEKGVPRPGALRYLYPRPIVLRDGRIICAIRFQRDPRSVVWTVIYESLNGGRDWHYLSRVNDWGAPGDIIEMSDGRIVCVYGYRVRPYGIRARLSEDGGRSWGSELILRDDGGSWDLGYPRVIEHEPGRLLTVYYMNTRDDPMQMEGGVRHIAQTVFSPD